MSENNSVVQLEELTLNTSPAIHQSFFDGWILRASNTDTRRANSVTTLYCSGGGSVGSNAAVDAAFSSAHSFVRALDEKIAYCEAWYAERNQRTIFRLTEELAPPQLDAMLAARGYTREVETLVMTLPVKASLALPTLPANVKLLERTTAEGIADAHRLKGSAIEAAGQDLKRQSIWRGMQKFLALATANGVVCCGMARIEDGHVGIFNMRTDIAARSKGYASLLVAYLIDWGRRNGAHTAFLQVDCENTSAITIYRRFGFIPQYLYWHRLQSMPS